MALVGLLVMIFIAPAVGAVNSISATGPANERSHNNHRTAISEANDELNDYYNTDGQTHHVFTSGLRVSNLLMNFQELQYQHFILAAHGKDGDVIYMGTSDDNEPLEADMLTDYIKTGDGDNPGWMHAAAPLGCFILGSCDSSKGAIGMDFKEAFMDNLYAWFFVGHPKSVQVGNVREFIVEYSDEVTDGRRSYERAWEEGVKSVTYVPWNRYESTMIYRKDCANKDHDTKLDRYRLIARNEGSEGTSLSYGYSTSFSFSRSFSGTSNGGYLVFHGIVNNDEDDLTNAVKITLKVYKWSNNAWVEEAGYTSTWDPVKNRSCGEYGNTQYGGSDICSVYVKPAFLTGTIGSGQIKFEVSNVNDGHSDTIQIDRFEFMEIGR